MLHIEQIVRYVYRKGSNMIALIVLAFAIPVLGIVGVILAAHYGRVDMIQDITGLSTAVWLIATYVFMAADNVPAAIVSAMGAAYYTYGWIIDRRRAAAA